MKFAVLMLSVLFSFNSFAEALRSSEALKVEIHGKNLSGNLAVGYHFNEKAPNKLSIGKKELKPNKISHDHVEFSLPGEAKQNGKVALYVCDDANTFCETHRLDLAALTQPGGSVVDEKSVESPERVKAKSARLVHGFIDNDFDAAIEKSRATSQPIFMEFGARWCPGCVRYENEIMPTTQFKKMSVGFVKLKIDVDLFDNFKLSDRFAVKGIPCVVVIDAAGREIARMSDYQPLPVLAEFMQMIKNDPAPIEALLTQSQSKEDKNSAALLKLGKRFLASNEFAAAIQYLGQIETAPPELLSAQTGLAKANYEKNPAQKSEYIAQLRKAIRAEPESMRSLAWRGDLAGLLEVGSVEQKTIAEEAGKIADRITADSQVLDAAAATDDVGEFKGYERMLVYMYLAEVMDAAHMDASSAWGKAAQAGEAYKIPINKSGPALRYLIILTAAKKYSQAEGFADQMLKANPKNEDLKRRKMKILLALNKNKDAVNLGETIISKAEGRIQFWVAELLAKAYVADQRKEQAKTVLQQYLARNEIHDKKMESTKKSMEELLANLSK